MLKRLLISMCIIAGTSACGTNPSVAQPSATQLVVSATAPVASPLPPTAEPTLAAEPTAATQSLTAAPSESITIAGTVDIQPRQPLPADAVLTIQFRRWDRDGIGFFSVVDEQKITQVNPGTHQFALTYQPSAIRPNGPYISNEIHAKLSAPGRIPWETIHPFPHDAPPTNLALTLQPPADIGSITGILTVPQEPPLPPDATLTIRIIPSWGFDPPGVGQLSLASVTPGQVPFTIEYPSRAINVDQPYAIHAEVRAGPELLLTTAALPVITQGHATTVDTALAPPQSPSALSGSIRYPAGTELPADATLVLELRDISMADSPSPLLAKVETSPIRAEETPFSIEYDPAVIDSTRLYALIVFVRAGEQTVLAGETSYTVITQGYPTYVEVQLITVDAPPG